LALQSEILDGLNRLRNIRWYWSTSFAAVWDW